MGNSFGESGYKLWGVVAGRGIRMVDFHLVMETLNFGVMVIDDQERIVYCNRKEAELRGVETNCIIGQSIYDCHRPEAGGNRRNYRCF